MRATIRDPETLGSVRPRDLAAYLRAKGWQQSNLFPGRSIWRLGSNGDTFEILLPLDDTFRDYALRISDVLRTLEEVEDRSQLELIADVSMTFTDVVRVAARSGSGSASIDLDAGIELINSAREMMAAAACAAEKPQPQYATRKTDKVRGYTSSLELGQTERGSYVITVLSPLPAVPQQVLLDEELLEEPFERKVTMTLTGALSGVVLAAERAVVSGSLAPFKDAVEQGVSANLCDALVRLHSAAGGERLKLGVSWASSRPFRGSPPAPVQIGPDAVGVIAEASRVLGPRKEEPQREIKLVGVVTALKWDDESSPGKVTVTGAVGGDIRKVAFELGHEDYHRAIAAHDSRSVVQCFGELDRKGTALRLENPRDFAVVE
jgi:hypothetical protein